MALSAVVFDVGETLVDEATTYERWRAERATTFVFADRDLHADALPCLTALRARGLRLGAAGNMHARHEEFLRPHVDFVGSSERWGVEKPDAGFFAHVVEEAGAPAEEILYVGDRVDNDVVPARAAGLHARPDPPGRARAGRVAGRHHHHRLARRSCRRRSTVSEYRVGTGFDAHALEEGVPLVLGGVRIEHPRGLAGHSDGDVLAHALTDALLGAAGTRGHRRALPVGRPRARRCRLARAPRRGPGSAFGGTGGGSRTQTSCSSARSRASRRIGTRCARRLAAALDVEPELVAVRATTTDGLGFTGRGEGLAAQAVALLVR